jgi:PAS domain S-box-containing protein
MAVVTRHLESCDDPFRVLTSEFATLQKHLYHLRHGAEAGLTALRSRLDRLSVAALVADNTGRYLAVNRAASELTGFAGSELESMSVWDLTPSTDRASGTRLWAAFIEMNEQRGTYSLQGKHGIINDVQYLAHAHVLPDVHLSLLHRA